MCGTPCAKRNWGHCVLILLLTYRLLTRFLTSVRASGSVELLSHEARCNQDKVNARTGFSPSMTGNRVGWEIDTGSGDSELQIRQTHHACLSIVPTATAAQGVHGLLSPRTLRPSSL